MKQVATICRSSLQAGEASDEGSFGNKTWCCGQMLLLDSHDIAQIKEIDVETLMVLELAGENRDDGMQQHAKAEQLDVLFTHLYVDLCRVARREIYRTSSVGSMSTRELVHEAWMDISRRQKLAFDGPDQFLAYASRAMRGLIIDRIRAQHTQKRGGGAFVASLDEYADNLIELQQLTTEPDGHLMDLSDALDELAKLEPQLAQVVDLKFFGGFGIFEIAEAIGTSPRTVQRQWDKARLLLHSALQPR